MVICVENFSKTFRTGLRRKKSRGATNISFAVEAGEVFGFLGPNGAGKTTTIKALLGLIRPDTGKLSILGKDVSSIEWRTQVGYMPEHPTFYDYLTGFEMVVWFGKLFGLSRHDAEKEAKRHLSRVGLEQAMRRRMRGYSKGMLQRAGLAQAMIGSPKLLVLDEPMTGLDPIGRRDIRQLILELKSEGCTIFYSTHILPDVEMTCDRVTIIDRGVSRRTGRLSDILGETTKGVSVVVGKLGDAQVETVTQEYTRAKVADGAIQVDFGNADDARAFLSRVVKLGGELIRFEPHRNDLESIFLTSLAEETKKEQNV